MATGSTEFVVVTPDSTAGTSLISVPSSILLELNVPDISSLLCSNSVIFCGESPILSLMVSFMLAILVLDCRHREKHGPMVGWILTETGFGLSFLLLLLLLEPPVPPPDEEPLGDRLLDGGVAMSWRSS